VGDVPDDLVMAYIDGELDGDLQAADRQRVERALAEDPALRRLAERYRATRTPVQAAFDGVLREPVPDKLLEFIRTSPMGLAAPASGPAVANSTVSEIDFRASRPQPIARAPSRSFTPSRMAAGIALLLAAGAAGWQMRAQIPTEQAAAARIAETPKDRWSVIAGALQTTLETVASEVAVPVLTRGTSEATIRVASTFLANDKRFCRQYAVVTTPVTLDGLACRTPEADWIVEYQVRHVAVAEGTGKTRPAEARDRFKIDKAAEAMNAGGVLDKHEEDLLLRSRWTEKLPER
jgi:anti-sigma factor RsiW